MESKPFWKSKTIWANVIAVAALAIQTQTGFVISPDMQALALGALNLVLRFSTDSAVTKN